MLGINKFIHKAFAGKNKGNKFKNWCKKKKTRKKHKELKRKKNNKIIAFKI